MKKIIIAMIALCVCVAVPALAQQTTGNIQGRIVDAQGAAMPGVTVTAKHDATGFTRSAVSDAEGLYRLNAMPIGTYELHAELSGFAPYEGKGLIVNVSQTVDANIELKMAGVAETVSVTAESPLIQTTNSSVGGVVDMKRIENLPLNGRQFANLAATVPGVGLGMHSDPTKSTQFSPQINGGAGRNVNYQIDGGDNNDDTVGGLLQLYPLEAIQEFNFITQRFKAEYGRSNGGVLNVVTKSGTNLWSGSFFELFRDKSMNAQTQTEKLSEVDKQDYRRNQFGGSFGGPIAKDKVFFFVAAERTQQDTTQAVNTEGLFPDKDGVFPIPYRENLVTGKFTANLNASHYLAVRYGRNSNSQPYGADAQSTFDNWGDSTNEFNSINVNHNWVLGGSTLNEIVFQYADFSNQILSRSSAPNETFQNGVTTGANLNTPQTTQQKKWQFRDDFTWHRTGMGGLGHDFKVGVNYINEPRLFITFNTGKGAIFNTHLTNEVGGPISTVTLERWRCVGKYSDEAVRHVHPGRLARDRSPHPEPRPALGSDDRLSVRRVEEPELRRSRRGGEGRSAQRHQGPREHGAEPGGRSRQLPAAHWRRIRREWRWQGRRSRRLGDLHGLRLHELERAVCCGRLVRQGIRDRLQRDRS